VTAEWADGASIRVNGTTPTAHAMPGVRVHTEEWKTGDRVQLELLLKMRLELLDARHTNRATDARAAGSHGCETGRGEPGAKDNAGQLLPAWQVSERQWRINMTTGPLTLVPFTSLGERPSTTYLNVS